MTARDLDHGWQLTGSSADAYDQLLVPAIFEPWAQGLVDLADPRPGENVLDAACGTGVVARTTAPGSDPMAPSQASTSTPACSPPPGAPTPVARDALAADLEDVLGAYVDDDGLALPIESHVAVATAGPGP